MKINKIILENFASYKKAELDFDKLGNMINMYGSTGSGKTTLIVDAITFCLFARAYGVEKIESLKYVIPANSNKSKAELIFTIHDKKFKITREVYKDKPSLAILEEFKNNSWIKISASVKYIDEFIKEKLNLDYKTFLSSIVIRQGDVINLLEASPSERREILLKAFNLDFSKYLEKAKEKRDKIEKEIVMLQSQIETFKTVISKEDEYRKELTKYLEEKKYAEESKKVLENRRIKESEKFNQIQSKINELKEKIIEYKKYKEKYDELINRLNKINEEINKIENEIKNKENLIKEKEEIENKINKFNEIINYQYQYNLKQNERNNLLKDLKRLEEEIKEIEEAEKKYIDLEKIKEKYSELEVKYLDLNLKYEDKVKEKASKEALLQQLREYLNVLKTSKEGICPVCKTKLSEEKILELEEHYINEINNLEKEIKYLSEEISNLDKERNSLNEELNEIEKELALEEHLKNIISKKNDIYTEFNSKKEELINLDNQINELSKILNNYKNINIENEKRKLEKLKEEKIQKITTIENYEKNLNNFIKEATEIENQLKELEIKLKEVPNLDEFNYLQNELEKQRKIIEEIDRSINEYSQKIGQYEGFIDSIEKNLKDIEEKKIKIKEIEEKINENKKTKQIYEILCNDVFNERGFPLVLLNSYLKDIEAFMNDNLSKVLPGKTVEIRHSEGKIEIIVRDDLYSRELATYSGGEKTILGFCLRLALAKVMALHRLGAVPKFLIVDEGFGPLSYEFRKAVLNLFSHIKEDYEKIIIISHIEDIKENPIFDTYIEVYKDENNISHINIK